MSEAVAGDGRCDSWPAWQRFKQLYVSDAGRVVDASTPQQVTVSEAQAYAMFFALVGNDRPTFDALLHWTGNHLARGDLTRTLPAWRWGRATDGNWRVLDDNAASDADLWIAYTLGEASRLWKEPSYAALGRALAARILQEEVASIPGLGPTLLPGPRGFVRDQVWRLNASYVPLQVVRGVARQNGGRLWSEVARSSERLIVESARRGFAADWIEYRDPEGFITDRSTKGIGSYDAIRVYLWAGLLSKSDRAHAKLATHLAPMIESAAARAAPVEKVDTNTLAMTGDGPPGFSAALLPMLVNAGASAAVQAHRGRVESHALKDDRAYYSDVLSLFGLGWLEGHYQFATSGALTVSWAKPCKPVPS